MFGIWSASSKRFVFGIKEETKRKAYRKLYKIIGKNAYKWRFSVREIKE